MWDKYGRTLFLLLFFLIQQSSNNNIKCNDRICNENSQTCHRIYRLLHSLSPPPRKPHHNPWSSNRYEFVYMQMSHHRPLCRHFRPPPLHTVAEQRWLGLLHALLLLELPELGLDGYGRLLSLRVLHVDVKVFRDVRLGLIWKWKEMLDVTYSSETVMLIMKLLHVHTFIVLFQ